MKNGCCLLSFIWLTQVASVFAVPSYHISILPDFSGGSVTFGLSSSQENRVYGINDAGSLSYTSASRTYGNPKATITSGASPQGIVQGLAWDINASGQGAGHQSSGGSQEAFFFDGSSYQSLGFLGTGAESRAFAINDNGQVVGWSRTSTESDEFHAFVYDSGAGSPVLVDLHAASSDLNNNFTNSTAFGINSNGLVVGVTSNETSQTAYVLNTSTNEAGSLSFNAGDEQNPLLRVTSAVDINDSDRAVGYYIDGSGNRKAVLWDSVTDVSVTSTDINATFTGIDGLDGSTNSAAAAVNNQGWVVGDAWKKNSGTDSLFGIKKNSTGSAAFLYDGTSSHNLNSLITSDLEWDIKSAQAINNNNQISGSAYLVYDTVVSTMGVVLSEKRDWTGSVDGNWDTAGNWANDIAPDATSAAYIELGHGGLVTGPASDTTIYAMTLKTVNPTDSATLEISDNTTLTVTVDTRLLGGTIDATGTGANFASSTIWGYGSLQGQIQADRVWVDRDQSLSVSGTLALSDGLLLNQGSSLAAEGTIGGAVKAAANTTITATGALAMGEATRNDGFKAESLVVGSHSVSLNDGDVAEVTDAQISGGSVTAANGFRTRTMDGHGTINADTQIIGLVQVTDAETLTINGDLTGVGMVVGNTSVSGQTAIDHSVSFSGSAVSSEAVDGSNKQITLFSQTVKNDVTLSNVTTSGAYGGYLAVSSRTESINNENVTVGSTLTISGTLGANGLSADSNSTIALDGDLTLATRTDQNYNASINAGSFHVGSHQLDYTGGASQLNVTADELTVNGGTLSGVGLASVENFSGNGTIDGRLRVGSSATLDGDLTVGDSTRQNGLYLPQETSLDVNSHALTIHSTNEATFDGDATVTISGGTINAANGILFDGTGGNSPSHSNGLFQAGGSGATSTVNGDVALVNTIVQATDGNTLNVNGSMIGHGMVIGNVSATNGINGGFPEADAGGVFKTYRDIDLGASDATIYSSFSAPAEINANLQMSGGTLSSEVAGIKLGFDQSIKGYGTINPGDSENFDVEGNPVQAVLEVRNGVIDVDAGQTLTVNGSVTGTGAVIGSLAVGDGVNWVDGEFGPEPQPWTLFNNPDGGANIKQDITAGSRNVTLYGTGQSTISGQHEITYEQWGTNSIGPVAAYSQEGVLNMQGGTLSAVGSVENPAAEIRLRETTFKGYGTVDSDLVVENSILDIDAAQTLTVNGTVSGYGIVRGGGTLSATSNSFMTAPSGVVDLYSSDQYLDLGADTAHIYSSQESILGNVKSAGGTLVTSADGTVIKFYEGYGSLDGDLILENSALFIDEGQTLQISGDLSGYGLIVGSGANAFDSLLDASGVALTKSYIDSQKTTGTVTITAPENIGNRTAYIMSAGTARMNNYGGGGSSSSSSGGSNNIGGEDPDVPKLVAPSGVIFGSLRGVAEVTVNSDKSVYIEDLLSPGFSPGTFTVIGGSLELGPDAVTEIEYFGIASGEYDFLDIAETFTLNGTLRIVFGDEFDPALNTVLPDFFAASSVEGMFTSFEWEGLSLGKGLDFDESTYQLTVVQSTAPIPEPTTTLLLLLSGAYLFFWRNRRR